MERSTVDAAPAFLPRQPPRALLGRDGERAWCADAFARRRVLALCGLPGIGKTSLMLTAAGEQAARVGGAIAYHACADGDRIGGVLASLLAGDPAAPRATPLRTALDEIVSRARRQPLVLCIDDAHRMTDPLLLEVLAHLGAALAPLWLVLASRRHVPLPEADIDGAILRLGPLSLDSARTLWADLEERFGASLMRFEALDAARWASPFALRRAFASGMRDADGGQASDAVAGVDLGGLAPAQAALLAQICAFDGPVALDRLATVIPDQIAALPGLLQALLVDATPDRSIAVHDIVRAAVARSARPAGIAEHEVCLRFYELGGGGHQLARLRHTLGAARWQAAAELIDRLVRPTYGFFPMGAAVERQVLAAFEALDATGIELSLPMRLARLQLAARAGRGQRVLELLRSEAQLAPAAWPHLGAVELLLGDARAAEVHLRQALADPSVASGPIVQICLHGLLLEVLRTQGSIDAMRDVQREFERIAAQLGPIGTAVAQVISAAMVYDREDFDAAAALLAAARPCIALLSLAPTLQAMHALLERTSHAAMIRPPDQAVPSAAVTRALFEDVDFFRATLLLFAADGDLLEGNLAVADARARDAEDVATRCGYRGIRQWALYVRIECLRARGCAAASVDLARQALADPVVVEHGRHHLLLRAALALGLAQLGRLPEARDQVPAIDGFAHAPVKAARLSVLPWIEPPVAASDLARAELAIAQLERALAAGDLAPARTWSEAARPVRASRWQHLRARLAVLDAELGVRSGEAAPAEAALAEAEALCAAGGYRREHAVAALIGVALARLAGDREAAVRWAELAAERAAGIAGDIAAAARAVVDAAAPAAPGAWPAWVDRLDLAAPPVVRLREPAGVRQLTQRQADAVRFAPAALGIDVRRRTVYLDGVAQPLANRRGLWSVLTALLAHPGQAVSPDDIARRAWGVDYHAVRHRSRLVVSIKRLRDALGPELIATVDGGYALTAPTWLVLE